MTQVLVVGMSVIDFLFEVDVMPTTAEKYAARDAQIVGGGGAANAACAIANLGGDACLVSRIGGDLIGELILKDLEQLSIDCSRMVICERGSSSYSSVLVDRNGERQIVNFRGSDLVDDVESIRSAKPNAVLADTRWRAGTNAAMQLAQNLGVPGVLDAEAPLDAEAMALASHIACSRQGLESLSGQLKDAKAIEAALRELATQYGAWLAMTDGEHGVYLLHKDAFSHVPAVPITPVDTLGAGDVWHGAFAYRLGAGDDELNAVHFANAAATIKCTRAGGGRSSPVRGEVYDFMEFHGLKTK